MVAVEGADNPFNGVDVGGAGNPTFVDVDNDGDMDAFVGAGGGYIRHFKNTGSATNPTFVEQTGTDNLFNGLNVGSATIPTFGHSVPIFFDTDGDLDVQIGNSEGVLLYFALTRCAPAPEHRCSGRGKCVFSVFSPSTSSFSSSCQRCVDSAGPQCESCVAGKIEQRYEHDAASSPRLDCQSCRTGYWSDTIGYSPTASCKVCEVGRMWTNATADCIDCEVGMYQSESGKAFCIPCRVGYYSKAERDDCHECMAGRFLDKLAYQDEGSGFPSDCIDCPVGFFQESKVQTYCVRAE